MQSEQTTSVTDNSPTKASGTEARRRWWRLLAAPFPWVIFLISILLTILATLANYRSTNVQLEQRFEAEADELSEQIRHRLAVYRSILYGFSGFLNTLGEVSRDSWQAYFDSLAIDEFYPGVQGVGFARLVTNEQLPQYEAAIREQGFSNFSVEPKSRNALLGPIEILEPFDPRNQLAFGYDMYSDPVRHEAMQSAWQTRDIVISGKVRLVQEGQTGTQPGFLMYLAYFPNVDANDLQQPLGWIYAPFRMNMLMANVFPNPNKRLAFAIYDQPTQSENLMYNTEGWRQGAARFTAARTVEFGHRQWQVAFQSQPNFAEGTHQLTWFILIAGTLQSLSLFGLALGYRMSRSDARLSEDLLGAKQYSESRIAAILDATTTALVTCDALGNIIEVNQPAIELFGYSRQTMVSMKVDALIPGQIRERHELFRAQYRKDPTRRRMAHDRDVYAQNVTGELIPVEVGLSPVKTDRGMHVLATIVDIRERLNEKREKERLLEQISAKNVEMEQFVYTVSHDLKSPLVTINGFAKLLRDSMQDQLDEKQSHWLARIFANVESMEGLLSDLLELSRIIHRALELEDVSLESALSEVTGGLSQQIRDSGAIIALDFNEPVIIAHRRLVVQCLQNLISNAIQYKKADEPLRITVGSRREDDFIVVYVIDNGIGIAPVHQSRIFEIFERLSAKSTSGSGVGLAVVKTAMEKHGGYVSVRSELGEQSEFMLHFPGK